MPIRLRNLINLDHSRHFLRGRDGRVFLVIPEDEVKNTRPLEFELSDQTKRLLDAYVRDHLPVLAAGWSMLFPGEAVEGRKHTVTLSGKIVSTIARYTGIRMHVHAFRHLAAKLILDRDPTQYAVVSQLLAHRSIDTTIQSYCGLQTRPAAKHYDEKVLNRSFQRRTLGKKRQG